MKSDLSKSIMHTSIFRLYLALVAFVGLIWTVIWYGNFWYEFIKNQIITDEQYIMGSRSYEMKTCEDPTYPSSGKETVVTPVKKTDAEIAKCKLEAKDRIIAERAYQLKDSAISGGVWGTLFFLVFLVHLTLLVRANTYKKDENVL